MRVVIALLIGACVGFAAKIDIIWNKTSDVSASDKGYAIVVDTSRDLNIYFAGEAVPAEPEARLVKYNGLGILHWNNPYPRGNQSSASGVAALFDTAYLAGYSFNGLDDDFYLVKCNTLGDTLWTRTFDYGRNERASGIVIDGNQNVYLTGSSYDATTSGFLTIKCNSDGDTVWTSMYDVAGYDAANDIYLEDNYIYVAGYTKTMTDENYRVIKYDLDGSLQWNKVFDSGNKDIAYGVAADESECVYVTGKTYSSGIDEDIWTIKCDPMGDTVWTRMFDDDENDCGCDISVCQERIYLMGYSNNGNDNDFLTIRYDSNGDSLWSFRYDSGDDDYAECIVAHPDYLYLAGTYDNGVNSDFRVIKCRENLISVSSPNGMERLLIGSGWDIEWSSMGDIDSVIIEYRNESTMGLDTIAVTANTGTYPWTIPDTPGSLTRVFISSKDDYEQIRDSSDRYFTIAATAVEETVDTQDKNLSLEISGANEITISYQLPCGSKPSLKIFSADGRMLRDLTPFMTTTSGKIVWDGCDKNSSPLPQGVYFVQLADTRGGIVSKGVLVR